jgi:hypothetical protein
MAKQEIAFGLKIDGVEQSIKSVKDLKGAISALQSEAETADLGSEQYKNAIENIELLNEKLKEVTQTEKQAAKASEDLANAEKEAAKETGDLRKQFEVLEDELFMLAGQGKQNTKEFRDLANEAAGLNKRIELVNQSLEGGAATKSAEGFQMLSGSLTNIKDGLLELDFGKVKDGLMQAKQGFMMFGQGAKTALSGVKGALLATGIGALVVALGVIVAYWDDIKGAVSGVSAEQKKLNEDSAANLQTQQDKLSAISAQENILKLQGKSEKEILQIKLKQTDEAIMASEVAIQQAENTKKAQVEASKRNREILQGIIEFVTYPITMLLKGIDTIGSAMGQNFNLLEKFSGGLANLVFDPEEVASEGDKAIAEAKAVNDKLKNDRAGLQLSVNKIDSDAAKEASEKAKAAAEEAKKLREEKLAADIAAMKQIQDANIANEQDEQKRAIKKSILDQQRRVEEINKTVTDETLKAELLKASETTFQNEMAAIYQAKLDKDKAANEKAAADKKAAEEKLRAETNAENTAKAELDVMEKGNELNDLIKQLEVKRDIELQNENLTASEKKLINEKYNQDVIKLNQDAENKKREDAFKIAQIGLESTQQLTDMFFMFKKNKAEKGSKEELELAKKQFNVQKAFNLAKVAMDGAMAISNIIATTPKADFGVMTAVLLASSAIATVTNMAKIASTKFDGGSASSGGGGGSAPSVPAIPPPPTIATPENNTNKNTSFDETGKNLNFQGSTMPTINVKASVGVDEITSKSNRVEVLEQQSTF